MNVQFFPQIDEAWNPYVSVQGIASIDPLTLASSALRAALIDKAIRQVEGISDALQHREMTRLPAVAQSLDLETGGLATNRLYNMLCSLKRFMTEPHHADVREKLSAALRPMDSWVRGRYSVTSPALMVIQAILYSYCEWSREYLFEAFSATRAFEEFDILGFPEQDQRFIAALIAHQTLLRTSWSTDNTRDPKEVLAFYREGNEIQFVGENGDQGDKAELMADRAIGQALARTLFAFFPEWTSKNGCSDSQQEAIPLRRRQLAAALILHSLCLSCRHSHKEPAMLKELKVQALRFLDHLLASGSKKPPQYYLAFFQYSRHVCQAQSDTALFKSAKKWIKEKVVNQENLENISFCFQRVSTKWVWSNVTLNQTESPNIIEVKPVNDIQDTSDVWKHVKSTIGTVWICTFDRAVYLLKTLGIKSSDPEFSSLKDLLSNWLLNKQAQTYDVLQNLLTKVQQRTQRFPGDHYYPAPLVGQVLRQMRDACSDQFTPLRIITRCAATSAAMPLGDTQFTVWLPKFKPEDIEKDPTEIWTGESFDPSLLIARYVATMVIGRAVSFAPSEILLDYYSEDVRKKWGKIIDRALYENGGPMMRTYITQLNCKPADFRSIKVLETHHVIVSRKERQAVNQDQYILGIDIGGTAIKMLRFQVNDLINNLEGETISFKEAGKESLELKSVTGDSPEQVIENIVNKCNNDPFEKCIAVGISLPCPVSNKQPMVPQAPTFSLPNLFNTVTPYITQANPLDFHKLDFTKAITNKYFKIKTVSVLNDGNADIRDSEDELMIPAHEGITVVLKAGTGVAFAVYQNGEPIELKAETSKAPLNLWAKPELDKTEEERFQQGTIREFCSKNGLKKLTDDVIKKTASEEYFNDPGKLIGPLLREALAGRKINFGDSISVDQGTTSTIPLKVDLLENTIFDEKLNICKNNEPELIQIYDSAIKIDRQRHVSSLANKLDEWKKNQDVGIADVMNEIRGWGKKTPKDMYNSLSDLQKFAVGCAWVLGGWIADAIAQVVDIYGAREIRLAGGPLSGATGLLVAASAEEALKTVYGFDLDVIFDLQQKQLDYMNPYGQPVPLHRVRELKRLRLVYPPEKSSVGGPRGAAKVALDAWIEREKQDELRRCRDWVNDKLTSGVPFNAKELMEKAATPDKPISLVSDSEVELMLAKEVSALGITRSPGGKFRKL